MLDGPDPMKAVICDLGISAAVTDQRNLTSTHEAVGTPIYRAPEAAYGAHTKASDIYSLGKTLEFMFLRVTPAQLGPGRCSRDSRLTADVWDDLDAILSKACAVDPAHRFQDVNELLRALPALVVATASGSTAKNARRTTTIALSADETTIRDQPENAEEGARADDDTPF